MIVYARIIENEGYLLWTTQDPQGQHNRYWPDYYNDEFGEDEVITLSADIPEDVMPNLLVHGGSKQYYSDGYEAYSVFMQYAKEVKAV